MARNIDADKLKDKIRPYYDKVLHQNISDVEKLAKHDMISDVMFEINKQPTAHVKESVRGKWVEDRGCFVCSNCGAAVSTVYPSTWAGCPYCLVDMRE